MPRTGSSPEGSVVSLSALDMFANAVGALAFLLLLFAANVIDLARPWPLKVLTERLPASQPGSEYIGVLAASGGVAPYTWSLASGPLPAGLRLDMERGEIVGTAGVEVAGRSFPLGFQVTDARRRSASARLELRVLARPRPEDTRTRPLVLLTHGDLPDGAVGKPYSLYLSARGGSGLYRWSAQGLPDGFAVAPAAGLLQGRGAAPGTHELILRVRDEGAAGGASEAVATAMLRVVGPRADAASTSEAPPPRILTERLPAAVEAEPYELRLAGEGALPLRWSAANLPAGLSLTENGVIRGTPAVATTSRVVVSLRDARDRSAPDAVLEMSVRRRPVSLGEIVRRPGLWEWLGYVLVALLEVAFLMLLRVRMAKDMALALRLHNVELIQRPDGTTALNGPPEATEAARGQLVQMHGADRRVRLISYVVLGAAMIGYTIFILR